MIRDAPLRSFGAEFEKVKPKHRDKHERIYSVMGPTRRNLVGDASGSLRLDSELFRWFIISILYVADTRTVLAALQ